MGYLLGKWSGANSPFQGVAIEGVVTFNFNFNFTLFSTSLFGYNHVSIKKKKKKKNRKRYICKKRKK